MIGFRLFFSSIAIFLLELSRSFFDLMQKSKLFYLHFYDFGLTEWAFSLRVYFFEDDDIDAGETTAMLC